EVLPEPRLHQGSRLALERLTALEPRLIDGRLVRLFLLRATRLARAAAVLAAGAGALQRPERRRRRRRSAHRGELTIHGAIAPCTARAICRPPCSGRGVGASRIASPLNASTVVDAGVANNPDATASRRVKSDVSSACSASRTIARFIASTGRPSSTICSIWR